MKSLLILWCLVSISALAGLADVFAQERKIPQPKGERAISLFTPQRKLWLYVGSDGSGTVGYGAGGSYQGIFKAGTLDVAQMTKELKSLALDEKSHQAWNSHYAIGFESERTAQEQPGPVRFTQDNKLILKLFEKVIESSDGLSNSLERPFLRAEIEKCRLEGTWVVASAEAEGKPVATLKETTLTLVNNELSATLGGKVHQGRYKIDPAKTPRHIEFWIGDTSGNWYRSYGVYELNGDELRVCRTGDLASVTGIQIDMMTAREITGVRPAKLDSRLGVLVVLKREVK